MTHAFSGFVWAQILLGVVGGFMAPLLFLNYAWMGHVATPLYAALITIGVLSGMEIPLIARVLEEIGAMKFRFENVLSVDYVGALVASLAFPLLVIPHLGLMSASLAFGGLNPAVAGLSLLLFRHWVSRLQVVVWALAFAATLVALWQSEKLVSVTEAELFEDDVILTEAAPYQQITVTRYRDRVRLFLDQSIQFDTLDEHRYHEPLVHPAIALAPRRADILVLGGGDGMAVRELLRYEDVEHVTLVDLDPRVTQIFREHPDLAELNDGALSDPRVTLVNEDAWKHLELDTRIYDVVIIDLPDPKSIALSRLYTRQFYGLLAERLSGQGVLVTQAGSPFFARQAFWSVVTTLKSSRNPRQPRLNGTSNLSRLDNTPPAHEDVDGGIGFLWPRMDRDMRLGQQQNTCHPTVTAEFVQFAHQHRGPGSFGRVHQGGFNPCGIAQRITAENINQNMHSHSRGGAEIHILHLPTIRRNGKTPGGCTQMVY